LGRAEWVVRMGMRAKYEAYLEISYGNLLAAQLAKHYSHKYTQFIKWEAK